MWRVYVTRDQLYTVCGPGEEAPWPYDYDFGPFASRQEAEEYRDALVHTSHACDGRCAYAGFCADDPAKCK
jgi:hypothetical protein